MYGLKFAQVSGTWFLTSFEVFNLHIQLTLGFDFFCFFKFAHNYNWRLYFAFLSLYVKVVIVI